MNTTSIINDIISNEQSFGVALAAVAPEMEALPRENLLTVNLDIPTAASTVLGCVERTVALCTSAEFALFSLTPEAVRKLRDYALACQECHTRCLTAVAAPRPLPALAEEAARLRTIFYGDAIALIVRERMPKSCLKGYKGTSGYVQRATDLAILITAFRGNWDRIAGNCGVQVCELRRAEKVVSELLCLSGTRENQGKAKKVAADNRRRAFTLMVTRYDEVRQAVICLRHRQGDADSFTPSLYAKARQAAKAKREEAKGVKAI